MKKILIVTITILTAFLFTQCSKSSSSTDIKYLKDQGQCGEYWLFNYENYESNEEAMQVAERYLRDSLDVGFSAMSIDSVNLGVICVVCEGCPNGWKYTILASEEDKEVLATLDFIPE